jgi:RimJ/RimL family protein N-acetyltransferase
MQLRDGSILIREWRSDDAEAVYLACQDPAIQYWMPVIPRPYTRQDARAFVTGEARVDGGYNFAVEDDGAGVVGSVGIVVDSAAAIGHAGYWCAPAARGRGIVPCALRLLCRHAVEELGVERVELVVDPDNASSLRVAEKAGFTREGVLRSHLPYPDGRRRDSVIFSLLPGELGADAL